MMPVDTELMVVQILEQLMVVDMALLISQDTLMKALMFSVTKEEAGAWLI